MLDLREGRVNIFLLLRKTFKAKYLRNDIDIISHVELGVGIPYTGEIHKLLKPGQNVALQPFVLGLTVGQLKHHKKWARIGMGFL